MSVFFCAAITWRASLESRSHDEMCNRFFLHWMRSNSRMLSLLFIDNAFIYIILLLNCIFISTIRYSFFQYQTWLSRCQNSKNLICQIENKDFSALKNCFKKKMLKKRVRSPLFTTKDRYSRYHEISDLKNDIFPFPFECVSYRFSLWKLLILNFLWFLLRI